LGRHKYKLLESYDEWLRGGVVDPGHYRPDPGDEVPVINIVKDNDPDSEAERLTALLGVMLSVAGFIPSSLGIPAVVCVL